MGMISVYITNPDKEVASNVAKHLLEQRLIACANMHVGRSFYWWEDQIQDSKEVILICKALDKNYNKIVKEVRKVHTYKVPCIMKFVVNANKDYETWASKVSAMKRGKKTVKKGNN